jgi:amino acid efflux transporter
VSIVVGSGLLVLPGLAYARVGGSALYAWLICGTLTAPLLAVFVWLGRRHPGAGGIAGYVQAAFGRRWGAATETLVIGTLALGLSSVALTGGFYCAAALGTGAWSQTPAALALLALAGAVNRQGIRLSGRLQQVLTAVLVLVLLAVAVVALAGGHDPAATGIAPPAEWRSAVPVLSSVFFAFTGWEMLSFTTGEYRRPERDFPIAVAASFALVLGLYALIAVALQRTLPPAAPQTRRAPVAAMLGGALGPDAVRTVAALGTVIVAANLIGAVWAASRLIWSSARQGLLPAPLARVHPGSAVPRAAVWTAITLLGTLSLLSGCHVVPLTALFSLAGENFFLMYAGCVAAFVRLARSAAARVAGSVLLAACAGVLACFGWGFLYASGCAAAGLVIHAVRERRVRVRAEAAGEVRTAGEV